MTKWYVLDYEHSVTGKITFVTDSLFEFGKKLEEVMFNGLVLETSIDFRTKELPDGKKPQ